MIFAEVIVDISVKSLDRPFQYIIPEELEEDAVVGAMVKIPFGNGNRTMQGYIIGISGEPKFDVSRTKSILEVVKQGVVAESHLLSLAYWIKENYGATMNDAIKAVMPVRRETREAVEKRAVPAVDKDQMAAALKACEEKHFTARARVLRTLMEQEDYESGADQAWLRKEKKATSEVLNGLKKQGLIRIEETRRYRNPVYEGWTEDEIIPELNAEQQRIVDAVSADFMEGKRETYLIHGVTGSGKTEVYIRIIEQAVALGYQAIVLIPEIALTFQTVGRFMKRFGDRVSVMHSRLSQGERSDQFERAKAGELDVMIGPRSALFTPFLNLGLIVMDEEHETSYQSESPPKYHAREVAVQRAGMLHASLILGSATPSMESYYRAMHGRYRLFTLKQRTGNAALPQVHITDMRQELAKRNRSIFGEELSGMIRQRLSRKEQTILFLNRRGYAGAVSCRECGEPVKCPHCSVSLTAHLHYGKPDRLECHYCGYQTDMMKNCPACGSRYIGMFGIGTQKVEEMVKKTFPEARVLRMDADTTTGKDGHEKILQQFASGEADILVGTQMIVKGHDFPNVTLVGILAADLSLNISDFRGAERTFQLLAQAAGRAGRGEKPGDVVLQTYQPEHYSIQCAARQDYENFFEQELSQREMLQYPPVSNILGVLVLSADEKLAGRLAADAAARMKAYQEIAVLGPAPASLAKAKDIFRFMVYAKGEDYRVLRQIKNMLEAYLHDTKAYQNCRMQFEFN